MKEVTVWQAEDGTEFPSQNACMKYEAECEILSLIKHSYVPRYFLSLDILAIIKEHKVQILHYLEMPDE